MYADTHADTHAAPDQHDPSPDAVGARPMSARERRMGVLCHLSALLGFLTPIYLLEIVGPLVLWLMYRDEMPFVESEGREAVNFQLTMFALQLCCLPLVLILVGVPLIWGLKLLNLILIVVASVRTSEGRPFRYPLAVRFLS